MASLYDLNSGHTITEGLQGCNVCDEALNIAKRTAAETRRSVLLEDDDGEWIVGPSGRIRKMTPALQRRYGFNQQQEF
jgi:hypothetical protein